jgi:hypothetical protein
MHILAKNHIMIDYKVNAGWEVKDSNTVCRWFLAWQEIDEQQIAGVVGGYEGGGNFLVERFWGKVEKGEIVSLWMDLTDRVTEEEIQFETLAEEIRDIANDAEDELWNWNNQDVWFDDEQLILEDGKEESLEVADDMVYLRRDEAPYLSALCELAGLTAGPITS